MTSLFERLAKNNPQIKRKLYMAALDEQPEEYIKKAFMGALWMAAGIGFVALMLLIKQKENPLLAVIVAGIFFWMMYRVQMKRVDAKISRRAKEIDKDVLFAGRFLLIKLNSGRPLINSLEDATKSYGISNEYFKEIIKDIDLGTPLEKALEKATTNCPSPKLKKILFQITNALKIGTNITDFLEAILDDIAQEQLIEIQRYGKKLSSITMFYMLFAIVMPSLGMTMVVVIVSLININLGKMDFMLINVVLGFLQFVFLTMFKQIRPNVHI